MAAMKRLVTACVVVGIVLGLTSVSNAQDVIWTGANSQDWMDPGNWDDGMGNPGCPVADGEAVLDPPAAESGTHPIIGPGDEAICGVLTTYAAGVPVLEMTGGHLEVAGWGVWWGDGAGSYAELYMYDGQIDLTGSPGIFEIGWGGGAGTVYQYGGEINAGGLQVPTDSGDWGRLFLMGGVFNCGDSRGGLNVELANGPMIDFGGGKLVLLGDERDKVDDLITAGVMTGYGIPGNVVRHYTGTHTIVRVPEPATISLLASLVVLGGVAWLFRRR
jgi:hypothetical protein